MAVKQFVDSKVADQQHVPSTNTTTTTQFLRMLYYSTVFLGFTSVTTEEKKKFDFEVSNLEVILPVLVAFMEFILMLF